MSADPQFTVEPNTHPASDDQRSAILANPGFGQYFSDHMAIATWTAGSGWHDARITAFGPLELSPATAVFHYAQSVFEGMKAYRHPDDSIHAFRPEANARRFARSARRLALPELPGIVSLNWPTRMKCRRFCTGPFAARNRSSVRSVCSVSCALW